MVQSDAVSGMMGQPVGRVRGFDETVLRMRGNIKKTYKMSQVGDNSQATGFTVGFVGASFGFVAFLSQLRGAEEKPARNADGIVVLTGGLLGGVM